MAEGSDFCNDNSKISPEQISTLQKAWGKWSLNLLDQSSSENCSNHTKNSLDFYCEKCNVPICRDCTVKLHKGHKIEDMCLILSKYFTKLEKLKEESEDTLQKLKNEIEIQEKTLPEIKSMREILIQQVTSDFEEKTLKLIERKNVLVAEIFSSCSTQKETVHNQFEELTAHYTQLQSLLEEMEYARNESNNAKAMRIYGDIRTKVDEINTNLNLIKIPCIRKLNVVFDEEQTFQRILSKRGKIKVE